MNDILKHIFDNVWQLGSIQLVCSINFYLLLWRWFTMMNDGIVISVLNASLTVYDLLWLQCFGSCIMIVLWHYNSTFKQDAQLSQRDRAAGCVIVFAKSTLWVKKNWATIHLFVTLTNVGRFSKFFHWCILHEICNKTHSTLPTTPQMCRCTTLRNKKERNWRNSATFNTVSLH